jgi:hypothetical protein
MRTIATDIRIILTLIATKVGRPVEMKNSDPDKIPTVATIRAEGRKYIRQKTQPIAVVAKKKAI